MGWPGASITEIDFEISLNQVIRREGTPLGRHTGGVAQPDGVSSAHRVARTGFAHSRVIILSPDKVLFLQDQCRRLAGNGYRCRSDGLWRGERIPGQRQTPQLLPPMETAEVQ